MIVVWYAWALVVVIGLNSLLKVALIGAPRKPWTKRDALIGVVEAPLWIWAVVALATGGH